MTGFAGSESRSPERDSGELALSVVDGVVSARSALAHCLHDWRETSPAAGHRREKQSGKGLQVLESAL